MTTITHPSQLDPSEVRFCPECSTEFAEAKELRPCCQEFLFDLHHPPEENDFAEVRRRLQRLSEEREELREDIEATYAYWKGRIDQFERECKLRREREAERREDQRRFGEKLQSMTRGCIDAIDNTIDKLRD